MRQTRAGYVSILLHRPINGSAQMTAAAAVPYVAADLAAASGGGGGRQVLGPPQQQLRNRFLRRRGQQQYDSCVGSQSMHSIEGLVVVLDGRLSAAAGDSRRPPSHQRAEDRRAARDGLLNRRARSMAVRLPNESPE
jgi:hypothetical protein